MPKTAPLKVPLADDYAEVRRFVGEMLVSQGFLTIEAASGEESVQRFAAERPDWVLTDLRMAGMGGIEATEAIRQLDPQARVIIISQFNEAEYREQARRAGALDFLNKEDLSPLVENIGAQQPATLNPFHK